MPASPFATGQLEQTPQYQAYLDVKQDVFPWLQMPAVEETTALTKVTMLTNFACQWAQRYLGRPIAPTKFTRRFNGWAGWNGAIIELPYYPVLSVGKVVEWWSTSGPHELEEQTPEKQGGGEMFQLDPLRGHIIRTFMGLVERPFFPGVRNIEIEWTAGYEPVPEDIKIATLELIAHWWRNTQQASRSAARPLDEYDEANPAGGMWGAIPHRVTSLLSPFEQQALA